MTSHPLFREVPPWLIVLEVFTLLRLPKEFPTTFQKQDIDLSRTDEAVAMLEPYYIPCKARKFLDYTTELRWITILRHILLPHAYVLTIQETTRNKQKAIFYTVERAYNTLREAIKLDFS
jgi:hypothetical protein